MVLYFKEANSGWGMPETSRLYLSIEAAVSRGEPINRLDNAECVLMRG